MPFNFGTVAAAAFAFASLGNTHLIMKTPVPFGVGTLNNSPLVDIAPGAPSSDYPCKQRPGVYDITSMNHMKVGVPNELSFEGSASHGGGTCQLAVTLDTEPTANSTFKLIQVFEGGCPVDSNGNGLTHPFSFSIPKDFPNGVSTLAWVWYNRIGNRELYMNCAPITVTGGSDNTGYYDTLPNMYVINLPTGSCQSTQQFESNAMIIPHPGQFIMRQPAGQSLTTASGTGCAASAAQQTEGVTGYQSNVITTNGAAYKAPATNGDVIGPAAPGATDASALPGGSGGAVSSPAAATTGSAASSSQSSVAGGMVTISTVVSVTASSVPAATSSVVASSSFPQMTPSGGAGLAGPSSAGASGVAPAPPAGTGSSCSSAGMACSSDGKKFGLCANGVEVWQPVAPGTSCKNGQIVKRSVFNNPHVRRHAQRAVQHKHYDTI